MNKINKVIEESNKEFDEKFPESFHLTINNSKILKSFISQRDQKILSAIEEEVEGLPNLRIESIDHYGRKILWRGLTNKSDIQLLLKSAKEQIK